MCCPPPSPSQCLPAPPLSSFLSAGHGSSLNAVPDSCPQFLSLASLLVTLSFLWPNIWRKQLRGRAGLASQSSGKAYWLVGA